MCAAASSSERAMSSATPPTGPDSPAPQRRALSPAELCRLAGALTAQGRPAEAEAAYRRAVRLLPDDAAPHAGLGLLLAERDALDEAQELLRRACALAPQDAGIHNSLGRLALRRRQHDEALTCFQAALALAPDQPEAHFNRAQALAALGRHGEAMAGWRVALALAPGLAPAHFALGAALQAAGDLAAARPHLQQAAAEKHPAATAALARLLAAQGDTEAANAMFTQALALAPDNAVLHNDAGTALAEAKDYERAVALFSRAVELQPELAGAHNNLGNALAALRRWPEAAAAYRAALALAPDLAMAHNNLGNVLAALKSWAEAAAAYRAALALAPDFAEAHGNLGIAALEQLRAEEALAFFDAALAIGPARPEYHQGRGRALMFLGDLAAARAAHEEAVRLAPDQPEFYAGLAVTQTLEADDPAFHALQAFAETVENQPLSARVAVHFALHRSLEHQGRHEAAFAHLVQGNALRRSLLAYDEAWMMRYFARVATVFGSAVLTRAAPVASAPDVPIFILGMPRSGSTLIEQILASHRDVFGAGELTYMSDIAATLTASGLAYPENVLARSDAELAAAGARYRARLRALAPRAPRITDKMPANFIHIGLLRLILPGARIIHTRRDALDTCLSCFAQTFGEGQAFTNDLGELGRHYRAYEGLMAHWRRHLPEGAMLEVDYEELVADFEPQVRRILDYCNLAWDPACLAFHEHQRPVLTASAAQVRQPLYRHAVGRARPYGTLLAPLLEALGRES